LTGFIFIKQNMFHKEEITNVITENYTNFIKNIYSDILIELNKRPDSKLFRSLFDNNIFTLGNNNNNSKNNIEEIDIKNISNSDMNICLQINCAISNYALFYYTHVVHKDYEFFVRSQNYRVLKIIFTYLHSPIYRTVLKDYLNKGGGLFTLKFFKEFFNISLNYPIINEEKLITENTIINGKINGKKSINAPTVSSFDIFHIDKKHNLVV